MGRPKIDPNRKKKTASFTLSTEQRILCDWAAAQLGVSASEMVGALIEREAKRIARRSQKPLPDISPDQTRL